MRISIVFDIKPAPAGGGYQFMRALREYLISQGVYEENPHKSDVILFNSHQEAKLVTSLKKEYPHKLFIHRIDGPISLYSSKQDKRDSIVYALNKWIADCTIFQSNWSEEMNYELGLPKKECRSVIYNAPDDSIFYRNTDDVKQSAKIKLIATSWSMNENKGFDVYKWLDDNLDFNKYEMSFVGRSPVEFNNIKCIKPLPSDRLAEILRESDIFITASRKDPCSNSLIEALHCGLPAIAYHDGGHPEIIKGGGELFENPQEIPLLLEKMVGNYKDYVGLISVDSIDLIGEQYLSFIRSVYNKMQQGKLKKRKFSFIYSMIIGYYLMKYRITSVFNYFLRKLRDDK